MSKSTTPVPAEIALQRSMAAYKAHATRQRNLLNAANHAEIKTVAKASLAKIESKISALLGTPKKAKKASKRSKVSAAPATTVIAESAAPATTANV